MASVYFVVVESGSAAVPPQTRGPRHGRGTWQPFVLAAKTEAATARDPSRTMQRPRARGAGERAVREPLSN